jgi:YegS/Rv2252/BmrU family lipid kinase
MARRWLVIVNPTAAQGRAERRWRRLAAALTAEGIDYDVTMTTAPGEATRLVRDADANAVLVVGGDGTVNEVLNGALARRELPLLAVAPYGTGNDWARGVGLPKDPRRLAALISRGRPRAFDVGYARDAAGKVHAFLNAAGVGFDAHVLERMAAAPRREAAYPRAAAAALYHYVRPHLSIKADGLSLDEPCLLAMVTLGATAGGGMRFTPAGWRREGEFGICVVRDAPFLSTLALLPRLYLGGLERSPLVVSARASRLRIEARVPARLEADGQLLGLTPVDFWVEPKAIRLIAPEVSDSSRA